MSRAACGGVLLTGGTSRRLGSDKARLRLDGETLAMRAARRLAAVCEPVVEVGPGVSDLPAVREEPPGSGPLPALLAGAAAVGTPSVVLLAVDLPLVGVPLLELLATWPGDVSVVPVAGGRTQLVCARYGPAALARAAIAARAPHAGERSLRTVARGDDVVLLDAHTWSPFAPPDAFVDVDSAADAARLGLDGPG